MGSNPTLRTCAAPTKPLDFGLWLKDVKGNRISTVERKLKYLKALHGIPEQMVAQILSFKWCDKSKNNALDAVCQYAEFLGSPIVKPKFRVYDNTELYVPNPEMVKQFVFRIRKVSLRAMVLVSVETGASVSEVWGVQWKDVNFATKEITIVGVKGHRTSTYPMSDNLCVLLMQLPRSDRPFPLKSARHTTDSIRDYGKRLAKETGNSDFLKIHFHTFRHFAISWFYFKTKLIVETQRFARHCNIQNTLRYIHVVKAWIKTDEYDVVYCDDKAEFAKYLGEGYELVAKTRWGFALRKPKMI